MFATQHVHICTNASYACVRKCMPACIYPIRITPFRQKQYWNIGLLVSMNVVALTLGKPSPALISLLVSIIVVALTLGEPSHETIQECRGLTRHRREPVVIFKHDTENRCSCATRPNRVCWHGWNNRHDTADTALKADTADTVEAILEQSRPEPPRRYHFRITQLPSCQTADIGDMSDMASLTRQTRPSDMACLTRHGRQALTGWHGMSSTIEYMTRVARCWYGALLTIGVDWNCHASQLWSSLLPLGRLLLVGLPLHC